MYYDVIINYFFMLLPCMEKQVYLFIYIMSAIPNLFINEYHLRSMYAPQTGAIASSLCGYFLFKYLMNLQNWRANKPKTVIYY